MMSKTQLEEEIAFPFNTGMPDLVLAYFHQNMLFCVCVCVCVNLKKRLSTKIRNLYFLKLDKFTTFPLFVTIFEAYKVS